MNLLSLSLIALLYISSLHLGSAAGDDFSSFARKKKKNGDAKTSRIIVMHLFLESLFKHFVFFFWLIFFAKKPLEFLKQRYNAPLQHTYIRIRTQINELCTARAALCEMLQCGARSVRQLLLRPPPRDNLNLTLSLCSVARLRTLTRASGSTFCFDYNVNEVISRFCVHPSTALSRLTLLKIVFYKFIFCLFFFCWLMMRMNEAIIHRASAQV